MPGTPYSLSGLPTVLHVYQHLPTPMQSFNMQLIRTNDNNNARTWLPIYIYIYRYIYIGIYIYEKNVYQPAGWEYSLSLRWRGSICYLTELRPAFRKKLNYQIPLSITFPYCLLLFSRPFILPLFIGYKLLFALFLYLFWSHCTFKLRP